jgi:hypothetical protein
MTSYRLPDFAQLRFRDAPGARCDSAPADGLLPEGSFSTTDLSTCLKVEGEFGFMSSEVSRDRSTDYGSMALLRVDERERGGNAIRVVGPDVLHVRGRHTVALFVENGFVDAFFGGNAVAVHEVESVVRAPTPGMDDQGTPGMGGHAFRMRAINRVRAAGSIAAVEAGGAGG